MKRFIPYMTMTAILVLSGLLTMNLGAGYLPGLLGTFLGGVLIAASLVACFTDLRTGMIRNSTTVSAFVIVGAVYLMGTQLDALRWGIIPHDQMLLGLFTCFFLTVVPYWVSRKGAGDVKLAALFGAVLGPLPGLAAVVLAYTLGAAVLFSSHLIHHGVQATFRALYKSLFSWVVPLWVAPPDSWEKSLLNRAIPLGPGFCLAAFVVLCRL